MEEKTVKEQIKEIDKALDYERFIIVQAQRTIADLQRQRTLLLPQLSTDDRINDFFHH